MKTCNYCKGRVVWLPVRGGKYLPFNYETVERELDGNQNGWVHRGNRRTGLVFMVPMREISEFKLANVVRVALLHHCAEREIAKTHVTSLEWADEFTKQMLLLMQGHNRRG